jgi:hypothetical protein
MHERPLDPPERKTYTGRCVFACYIQDVTVEVRAHVIDDEIQGYETEVIYCNTEVSGLMSPDQWASIQEQFDEDYHNIITFGELV